MWSEETIVHPAAWSHAQVERDLRRGILARDFGVVPQRDPSTGVAPLDVPLEKEPSGFAAEYDGAVQSAREQLATCSDPQVVSLSPGAATLVPFPIPSPEERAVHESVHESARLQAVQDAALIERINVLRTSNEHQQIEREARIHEWLNAEEQNLGAQLRAISGGASSPAFSSTPNIGSGLVPATLDTSLTAPSNITTLITAGSSGTQNYEVVVEGVGTTVAGVFNLFRYDGSTYHLYWQLLIAAITSSTTAVAFRQAQQFTNLVLKSGDSLRCSQTVSGNQSMLKATAHAGDI